MLFFLNVPWFSVCLKYFLQIKKFIAFDVFFTWIVAYSDLALSYMCKEFQDEMWHQEKFATLNLNRVGSQLESSNKDQFLQKS